MTNEEMEQLKSLQEEIAELKAEVAKLNAARGEDAKGFDGLGCNGRNDGR